MEAILRSGIVGWERFTFCRKFKQQNKTTIYMRPWKINEVPIGAWVRRIKTKGADGIDSIVSCGASHIRLGSGNNFTYKEILEFGEYSEDKGKTWNPCGINSNENETK
jgi:hypothetical protein